MTSSLPPFTVTCRLGHKSVTRAAGNTSISCSVCRKNGERVSVWVPASRPKTAKQAAAVAVRLADVGQDPGRPPVDSRWAAELPWSGKLTLQDGPAGDCPDCAGSLLMTPRQTLMWCQSCNQIEPPKAIADHYERQQQKSSEIAVMEQPDNETAMEARVLLRAAREDAENWLNDRLETWADENNYDTPAGKYEARRLGALLRGYLPEIRAAKSDGELSQIRSAISTWLASKPGIALRAEYDQALARAEAADERERIRVDQELAAAEERASWEAQNKRQREIEAQQVREQREADRTPRVITVKAEPVPTPSYPSPLEIIAAKMIESGIKKERQIGQRGECSFKHSFGPAPAARIYGPPELDGYGHPTGRWLPGGPLFRACSKHIGESKISVIVAELNRQGYAVVNWWEASDVSS